MSSCRGNSLVVCGDPGGAVARVLGVLHQQAPVLGELEPSHSPHELRAARHGNSGPQPQPRPAAFPCPPPCASRSAPTSSRRTWARRSPKGRMGESEQQPTGSPGCTQCRCGPWSRSPLSPVTRHGSCICPPAHARGSTVPVPAPRPDAVTGALPCLHRLPHRCPRVAPVSAPQPVPRGDTVPVSARGAGSGSRGGHRAPSGNSWPTAGPSPRLPLRRGRVSQSEKASHPSAAR